MLEVATSHGELEYILYNLFKKNSTLMGIKSQIFSRQISSASSSPVAQATLLQCRLRDLFNKLMNYEDVAPLRP